MQTTRAGPPEGYRFSADFSIAPADGALWKTTGPLWFEVGGKGSGAWVRVPAGFVSDGPSIPAIGRLVFNPADARMMRAALVHDWLLSLPGFSPLVAAVSFRDALRAAHLPSAMVTAMFLAVALYTLASRRRA